jgi:hypothetical protein
MGSFIRQREPNPGEDIMGLQNHGYVLYPDAQTELEIPYVNNRFRLGKSKETKWGLTNAQLKEFETYFGVEFDSESGHKFLEDWRIQLDHLANPVDMGNMRHKFSQTILVGNDGMGLVNLGDDEGAKLFPFVLVDEQKEIEGKVSRKVTKNNAIRELSDLEIKDKKLMVKVAKYLFNLNLDLTEIQAYDKLDDFINQSTTNAEQFLKALKTDKEWMDTTVLVKDAMNAQIIRRGEDQVYVNFANQQRLGRNMEEVVKYLNNPDNQDQLGTGGKNDQPYSIQAQLKQLIK